MPAGRTALLTAAALVCFAGNSLLCRAALRPRLVDPSTFTLVRLASGAAALGVLFAVARGARPRGGSWGSALALFAYAAAFSLAYVRIGAGVGALLLFAAVQVTMLGWSVAHGARPARLQWGGVALAALGLAGLTLPGAQAPDAAGSALMLAAGVAWGAYSLRGRGSKDPLAVTADNFLRSVPLAAALILAHGLGLAQAADLAGPPALGATAAGVALAATSGALASGGGYSLWYAAVPSLGATRAATVQLAVPVLAAAASVALLGETLTPRLAGAGAAVLGGVALTLRAPRAPPGAR